MVVQNVLKVGDFQLSSKNVNKKKFEFSLIKNPTCTETCDK